MTAPRAVIVGAGRLAGGFVAPALRASGWTVTLVCRDPKIRAAIDDRGGFHLRLGSRAQRWIDGVRAIGLEDPALRPAVTEADLVATSVGPTSLGDVGRLLAPFLYARALEGRPAVNVVTFENHRQAPELLAAGLFQACRPLAAQLGRSFALGGSAVWRTVSRRELGPDGVVFFGNDVAECYADAGSLIAGRPPFDGSVPAITAAVPFEPRIVEKLWVFNAGHAAAAYLGWHARAETVDQAMARPEIRERVRAVVIEARAAIASWSAGPSLPERGVDWMLERYADPELRDPVVRVAREPRRKLGANDRLIGPAVARLATGVFPDALARVAAAALAYGAPSDRQATDLQREIAHFGPEEVLGTVSTLDPSDELARRICAEYRDLAAREPVS